MDFNDLANFTSADAPGSRHLFVKLKMSDHKAVRNKR